MNAIGPVIPLVDPKRAPLLARPYVAGDAPGQLALTLAHVPESLEAVVAYLGAVYGPSALGERLTTLAILRTSVVNGCRYCTRVYREAALGAGLSEAEIAALMRPSADTPSFSARERAAIDFISAFCGSPERCAELLAGTFRDDERVSLALVVGTTVFLNRFATACGLA